MLNKYGNIYLVIERLVDLLIFGCYLVFVFIKIDVEKNIIWFNEWKNGWLLKIEVDIG